MKTRLEYINWPFTGCFRLRFVICFSWFFSNSFFVCLNFGLYFNPWSIQCMSYSYKKELYHLLTRWVTFRKNWGTAASVKFEFELWSRGIWKNSTSTVSPLWLFAFLLPISKILIKIHEVKNLIWSIIIISLNFLQYQSICITFLLKQSYHQYKVDYCWKKAVWFSFDFKTLFIS